MTQCALTTQDNLDWQPIASFPRDGNKYLATCDEIAGGFPQVVYYDDGRLHVPDARISYGIEFFSHWARISQPRLLSEKGKTDAS